MAACDNRDSQGELILEQRIDSILHLKAEQKAEYERMQDSLFRQISVRDSITGYGSIGRMIADTAKSYIGVKEENASNSGPEIAHFFIGCGVNPGVPWCGCSTNYSHMVNGVKGPSAPAWSPAWFPEDKIIWRRGDSYDFYFEPGTAFGLYFPRLGRIGHVGIIEEDLGVRVQTSEGNTNSQGGREGNGQFPRIRHKSEIMYLAKWHD